MKVDKTLKQEAGQFTNEQTGEVVQFQRYYIEFMGIKIYLKPNDSTSKQLLENIFKKEV